MIRCNTNIFFLALSLLILIVDAESKTDNSTVCYKPLGCFPTDGPWFSLLLRPFPAPDKPEDVGTKIYYFNRNNKEDGVLVYQNLQTDLKEAGFEGNRNYTFFITHGFLASGNSSWMTVMKDTLLNKMDASVFLVDWGKGAGTINYFQAASNTRVVGAELGRFIGKLKSDHKLNPSTIHLIGHSLGAHISSYAAKKVKGIGRITGLDAAQPGFEGLPKEVRIDRSDAGFVDLIHTNIRPTVPTLGFGMISAAGDVDIYVNGGLDQPGCYTPDGVNIVNINDLAKVPFKALAKWISCSHGKAYEYFSASLQANCKTWARSAGKLRSIVNAVTLGNIEPVTAAISKCSADSCTEMGLETPKYEARGVFAATTIRQYPFCDDSEPENDKKVKEEIRSNESRKLGVPSILKPLISL